MYKTKSKRLRNNIAEAAAAFVAAEADATSASEASFSSVDSNSGSDSPVSSHASKKKRKRLRRNKKRMATSSSSEEDSDNETVVKRKLKPKKPTMKELKEAGHRVLDQTQLRTYIVVAFTKRFKEPNESDWPSIAEILAAETGMNKRSIKAVFKNVALTCQTARLSAI